MFAEIDISNVVLKTERLTLRPFRQEDLEDFYEYANVDGVGQMAGWLPHENIEKTQAILDRFIAGKKTFALVYQGKVIGSLGIEMHHEGDYPELEPLLMRSLGYVLSKDYWGMGLMPEAVRAVIDYLFNEVKVDAIICCHFLFNNRSRRVIEKSGFRFYCYDIYETSYGTRETEAVYIMFRDEEAEKKMDKEKWMHVKWVDGFEIAVEREDNAVCINANREGLLSLANICITLANGKVNDHLHLDEHNGLEDGSAELIISQAAGKEE